MKSKIPTLLLLSVAFICVYTFPSLVVAFFGRNSDAMATIIMCVAAWTAAGTALSIALIRDKGHKPQLRHGKGLVLIGLGGLLAYSYYRVIIFGGPGFADLVEKPLGLPCFVLLGWFFSKKSPSRYAWAGVVVALAGYALLLISSGVLASKGISNAGGNSAALILNSLLGAFGSALAVVVGTAIVHTEKNPGGVGRFWIVFFRWCPIALVLTPLAASQDLTHIPPTVFLFSAIAGIALGAIWMLIFGIKTVHNSDDISLVGFLFLLTPFTNLVFSAIVGLPDELQSVSVAYLVPVFCLICLGAVVYELDDWLSKRRLQKSPLLAGSTIAKSV